MAGARSAGSPTVLLLKAGGETAHFVLNGVERVAEEIRDALGIGQAASAAGAPAPCMAGCSRGRRKTPPTSAAPAANTAPIRNARW